MKKLILIVAVVAITVIGGVGYAFLKAPEEASAPIEAIPLALKDESQTEAEADEVVEAMPTDTKEVPTAALQPTEIVATLSDAEVAVEAAIESPEAVEAGSTETEAAAFDNGAADTAAQPEVGSEESSAESSPTVFQIVQSESEARFIIGEILRGSPFTVVGVTNQVAAEFVVDAADLSSAQLGPVLINARTLETDNAYRNRAIKNRILTTDQHEFINFTPTELAGLTGGGSVGESYNFQISGDLTIRDVTRPVVFDASAMAISEDQIEGFATATVLYADYNIAIPSVPSVAGVDDEVTLEIDFVAIAKDLVNQG